MNNNPNRWMSAFFLLAMFSIVAFAGTRAGVQASSNVLVTNPTSQPVNVKQIGYLQTYVLGRPGVRIYNPDYAPIPTRNNDEPGRNAYAFYVNQYVNPGLASVSVAIASPPAGKRLVITHASANCYNSDPFTAVSLSLKNNANTTLSNRTFLLTVDPAGTVVTGSTDMFLRVDPTDTLIVSGVRSTSANNNDLYLNLEGYYVSMP
jgi:hypothetical protein